MDTSDFRTGISILMDGDIYTITDFQHVKPGKGGAFVRSTLKNVKTGRTLDKTWRAGERMEQAYLERRPMQYLYNDGSDYFLMDPETFDQMGVRKEQIGEGVKYLKENMDVTVMSHKDTILNIEVPNFVELEVTETAGSEKGDTASGGGKPATVETGAVINVPFFVKVGDKDQDRHPQRPILGTSQVTRPRPACVLAGSSFWEGGHTCQHRLIFPTL